MSEQTLKQMEDDWYLKMAARYGKDHPRSGERIFECDGKYMREVTALAVQIEQRKTAEASRPQINQDQLNWLNRVQAATDKDGKRPAQEISQKGTQLRKNLDDARQDVFGGKPLSAELIAGTEAEFARQGVTMPALTARPATTHRDMDGNVVGNTVLMPNAVDIAPALAQSISTTRDQVK